jgi:hypothetical protein
VLAPIELHHDGFEAVLGVFEISQILEIFGGRGRFRLGLVRRRDIVVFAMERERGRAHRAAALLHHGKAGQEIANLITAYMEAHAIVGYAAFAFEVGHSVATGGALAQAPTSNRPRPHNTGLLMVRKHRLDRGHAQTPGVTATRRGTDRRTCAQRAIAVTRSHRWSFTKQPWRPGRA